MNVFNDGVLIDRAAATLPLNSVTAAMGLMIFEALRCYPTDHGSGGLHVFRLADHHRRLTASLRSINVEVPMSREELQSAIGMVLTGNGITDSCYIKVIVYWDNELSGTSLFDLSTMRPKVAILPTFTPPAFFTSLPHLKCCVASWRRNADDAMPASVKASANYFNARLALVDAMRHGYENAIFLDHAGRVSEAAESNVFLIRSEDGAVVTPSLTGSILAGVTRDTVIRLLRRTGAHCVEEREVSRADLYSAEAVFLTNTARLVRNVVEVDGRPFDPGAARKVEAIRRDLLDVLFQREPSFQPWFDRVA